MTEAMSKIYPNLSVRPAVQSHAEAAPLNPRLEDLQDGQAYVLTHGDRIAFCEHWCKQCYLGDLPSGNQCSARDDLYGEFAPSPFLVGVSGRPACRQFELASTETTVEVDETHSSEPPAPAWAKAETPNKSILFEGRLTRYYAKFSDEEFFQAASQESVGKVLIGQLLDTRWSVEDRRKEGLPQRYYDIAFVDDLRRASYISLRGDSAQAIADKISVWTQRFKKHAMQFRLHFIRYGNFAVIHLINSYTTQVDAEQAEAFLRLEGDLWEGV